MRDTGTIKDGFLKKVLAVLSSDKFYYFLLGLFLFQAIWIAFSAVYPMAFDEDFHFGIIQLYAHHLSPFFSHQPAGANVYGALTRNSSYMYHYLLSFPLRMIVVFSKNIMVQITFLRLINIGMFVAALMIFRKILRFINTSPALSNTILLFVILTPLTSLLAAQINYDNFLILLTAYILLLCLQFIQSLYKLHQFSINKLGLIIALCFFTSLVKYAFLPIFLAIIIYLGIIIGKEYKHNKKRFTKSIKINFKLLSKSAKIGLLISLVLTSSLFIERYGYNVYKYHTPVPECDQVLNVQNCQDYGPWERNYTLAQLKGQMPQASLFQYTKGWGHTMLYGLFFAINGINSGFLAKPPLPLPEWTAVAIGGLSLILIVVYRKKLFQKGHHAERLFVLVAVVYVITLWYQNYEEYLHVGTAVAVQGRYLIPVLIPVYILSGFGFREFLKRRWRIKPSLTIIAALCFFAGGGVMTFIIRNDPSWYNSNTVVTHANKTAQKILRPVVPGSKLD